MATFAESWEYQNDLSIAKDSLDALDHARICDGKIIGQDNFNRLRVSTVFSCIAVEKALNDFLMIHFLFLDNVYLQAFFAEGRDRMLRADVWTKLKTVSRFWPDPFPHDLLNDVRKMFQIRNRIVHQTPTLQTRRESDDGKSSMSQITSEEMNHMLGHHDIASRYLGLFGLHGNRELQQWAPPDVEVPANDREELL